MGCGGVTYDRQPILLESTLRLQLVPAILDCQTDRILVERLLQHDANQRHCLAVDLQHPV